MSQKQILSWFWGDILGQEIPNLHDPYIQYYQELIIERSTTVLFDSLHSYRWFHSELVSVNNLPCLLKLLVLIIALNNMVLIYVSPEQLKSSGFIDSIQISFSLLF